MADGLLKNPQFEMGDAMGALGVGLLKLSSRQKMDPAKTLAIWNAMRNNGAAPIPGQEPFTGANPSFTLPANQTDTSVDRLMKSIGRLESGNNYAIIGPRTRSGDRAYGQYQVMGNNIPSWTKEVLGYSMTPDEFLQDKAAQDAVARAKLGGYIKKYGNINDAASMWFSGRPYRNNIAKDVLGTSVPQYVETVNRYY